MKRLIITLIAIVVIVNLYSQNQHTAYPHIIPMTPNAAELAKYADYPVSYYTGIPNTSVPLYEIEEDGFKLPITLNYHASGIRVDQEATWVGLGWSLDVESRISRTVKGVDDFKLNNYWDRNYPWVEKGYYDAPDRKLFVDYLVNLDNHYRLDGVEACPARGGYEYHLIYDSEPDIFYYNLSGMSGKFILDKSRGAVLFDKSHNLKIEVLRNSIAFFKITDAEGNQYLYNQSEITLDYTGNSALNKNSETSNTKYDDDIISYTDWTIITGSTCADEDEYIPSLQSPIPLTTSWCLTKVITKHGREINFTYDWENQYLPTQESCENYHYDVRSALFYYRSKVVNTGLRLKTIEGDFGRIEFSCSVRDDIKSDSALALSKKLDAVSIYNKTNTLIKSFKFDYTYFNDDYSGNPQYTHVFKRLKLNKLTEYSAANQPLNDGYNFSYYEGSFPAKNSKNVDYWGFQNGKSYGEKYYIGLNLTSTQKYLGVKKDANFEKAIIGTLKKITYPTKGTAEFKFESNTVSSGYFETYIYNGIDANNSTIVDLPVYNYFSVPEYDYYHPSEKYRFEIERQTTIKIGCSLENAGGNKDSNYNYYDIYNSYNSPLGELRKISSTSNIIKTYLCPKVYESSPSFPDGIGIEAELGTQVWSGQQEFTLESGTYEFEAYAPPKDVLAYWRLFFNPTYNYILDGPSTNAGGIRISEIKTNAKTRKFNYSIGKMLVEPVFYYAGTRVGIPNNMGCIVQVSESKTPLSTFNHGNFVGYDWVEEYLTDENNNVSKTKYTYHNETESEMFDDKYPDSPHYINYTNGLIQSIEKYKNTTLVEKDTISYTSTYGNIINAFRDRSQKRWDSEILEYNYKVEWPLQSKVIKTEKTNNGNSIISETNYSYNSKDLIQTTSYKQSKSSSLNSPEIIEKVQYPFDFPNDPVSIAMVAKNMIGIPITKETFRDNVNNKIASEKTIYDIFGTGLIAPKTVQTSNGTAGLEDRLKYNLYDINNGNLQEVEQSGGIKVSYIWGYKNTQPVAKLENIAYASIPQNLITAIQSATDSTTATEADVLTVLTALRNSTDVNMQKAMISTLTYKPLIGVSTITDPKGDTITYTYDSFGRLQNVKDKDGNILSENEYHYKN